MCISVKVVMVVIRSVTLHGAYDYSHFQFCMLSPLLSVCISQSVVKECPLSLLPLILQPAEWWNSQTTSPGLCFLCSLSAWPCSQHSAAPLLLEPLIKGLRRKINLFAQSSFWFQHTWCVRESLFVLAFGLFSLSHLPTASTTSGPTGRLSQWGLMSV